jgi:hypothetical protein
MRMRGQQHAVTRDGWKIPYLVHAKISSFHARVGRASALGLNGTVRTWPFVQPPAGYQYSMDGIFEDTCKCWKISVSTLL